MKQIYSEPMTSWTQTHSADCAVVLTGGAGRVRAGFDLLANKNIRKLIVSGVYYNSQLRDIMPNWPFYGNIDEADVVLERRAETTFGNAQQSLPIVEALHCRDILLVTSRLHMPRAYRTFKNVYPDTIYIIKYPVVASQFNPTLFDAGFEAFKSVFYSFWAF